MGPECGKLVNGEQWRSILVEREAHIHSSLGAKAEGTLCQSVFFLVQEHLRKQNYYNRMLMFGERTLQASNNHSVSLASAGEAEVANRMGPGASRPSVE